MPANSQLIKLITCYFENVSTIQTVPKRVLEAISQSEQIFESLLNFCTKSIESGQTYFKD